MVIQHYRKQKKIKKIKSDLNEIDKGTNNSENPKTVIKNILHVAGKSYQIV